MHPTSRSRTTTGLASFASPSYEAAGFRVSGPERERSRPRKPGGLLASGAYDVKDPPWPAACSA
jgi:hypothetical protein